MYHLTIWPFRVTSIYFLHTISSINGYENDGDDN